MLHDILLLRLAIRPALPKEAIISGGWNEWDRSCYVGYLSILPPFTLVKYAVQGREVAKTMTEPTEQGGMKSLTSHPAASNRSNPPLWAADVIRPYLIGLVFDPEAEYLKSKQTFKDFKNINFRTPQCASRAH